MPSYNRFYQKNKFNAKKTECLGILFDSKWEAERYGQLVMLQRANHIRDLKTQVRFDIVINEQKVCTYVADFTYYEINQDGSEQFIVEDAKGLETGVFRLKKKLMKTIKRIEILISNLLNNNLK